MNNDEYISALKRALAGMKRAAREEILREIESHMQEKPDAESLEAQFGPVDDLARQYLDGEPLPLSLGERLGRLGGKLIFALGVFVAAILVLAVALIWGFGGDKFDYADDAAIAREIAVNEWSSQAWSGAVELKIEQAHAVLYWHDKAELLWSCKGRDNIEPKPGDQVRLRHGFCLVYLPQTPLDLDILQSDVVLVQPQTPVALKVVQGDVRIAERGNRYRYDWQVQHSDVAVFESDANATTLIAISATESSVQHYQ